MGNSCIHLGIIMDGNGRWAVANGYPRIEGHRRGANNVSKVIKIACEMGIKYLTLYCFSTENWIRPTVEVQGLIQLLRIFLAKGTEQFVQDNIKVCTIGNLSRFATDVQKSIAKAKENTVHCDGMVVIFALNYGARDEIVRAVTSLRKENKKITEKNIAEALDTRDFPDPDLIIRTSGEERLSNFLLWQAAYSEFIFVNKTWPEFSKEDFRNAMDIFSKRVRRYGGI